MAYTPSPLKLKSTPNDFGGLRSDGNRIAMTGALGNTMLSQDATTSPVVSPASNMSGSGVALTVPQNAVQITISSTVIIQVGEDSSFAQGLNVPAAAIVTLDCANQQFVYLKPSSGTNTVSFQFKCV